MALEPIYRLPKVMELTGLSRSSIYLALSKGTFPKPIKLGQRSIGWPESLLIQWREEREEKSNENT